MKRQCPFWYLCILYFHLALTQGFAQGQADQWPTQHRYPPLDSANPAIQERAIHDFVADLQRMPSEQMDTCLIQFMEHIPKVPNHVWILKQMQPNTSSVYQHRQRIEAYIHHVLQMKARYDQPTLRAITCYMAADGYLKAGRLDSARVYYERLIREFPRNMVMDEHYLSSWNSLGIIARKKSEWPSAIAHFLHVQQTADSLGRQDWVFIASSNMAKTCYLQGDYPKAKSILLSILPYASQRPQWDGMELVTLAYIVRTEKKYQEAFRLLYEARERLNKKRMHNSLVEFGNFVTLYKAYADLYEETGQFEKALKAYQQYKAFSDTVSENERSKEMIRMQENYDIEYRNEQIKAAQAQNARHIAQRNGLLIAFGIGLTGLVAVLYQYMRANRLNRKLDEQADELRTSNQIKDKLFSIIAHDLRSPFSTMQGMIQLLRMGALNEAEKEKLLGNIEQQCGHTADMLDSLLIWARRQMNEVRQMPQPVAWLPEPFVQEVMQPLYIRAAEKNIALHLLSGPPIQVWADPDHIRIVLRNLIANAIKFTPTGGQIVVGWQAMPDNRLRFFVRDSGTGMSTDEQQALMDPARHFSRRGTAGEKGTGLGLLLCKDFVQANGGYMDLQSQPGQGSTFGFGLPIAEKRSAA